jgi:hypothetical protein
MWINAMVVLNYDFFRLSFLDSTFGAEPQLLPVLMKLFVDQVMFHTMFSLESMALTRLYGDSCCSVLLSWLYSLVLSACSML